MKGKKEKKEKAKKEKKDRKHRQSKKAKEPAPRKASKELKRELSSAQPAVAAEPVPPNSPVCFTVGDTRMQLTHGKLLQDDTFCDLVYTFSNPKFKKVHITAHKVIVKNRAPALLQEGKAISKLHFKKGRYETVLQETALPFLNPDILKYLLKYIYFGQLMLEKLPLVPLLDVTSCAVALEMKGLQWDCEHLLRQQLNAETIHVMLKGAEDRQLKSVKRIALAYSFANWDSFIGNKEGAKILGLELFQSVTAEYAQGAKVVDEEEAQPANTIVADYRRLYEQMPEPDIAIVVGAETIPCHRAILASYSDVLSSAFKGVKFTPGTPQPFPLSERLSSPQAVDSFLRFVYYGESKMEALDAAAMITHVNPHYRLNTFQFLCEHTIIHNISNKSAVPTLGVTYLPGLAEKPHIKSLRKQTLNFILSSFSDIDLEPIRSLNPAIQTDLLFSVQSSVRSGALGAGAGARSSLTSGASESSNTPRTHSRSSHVDDEVVVGASEEEEEV